MLSIQTNVNSLVAQQNLNTNSIFQSKTIQQLTSGYRINSSGDDAAGLAVANKFRSNISELTQGVANGHDGVASLQIMDGGMNNIAQILDRLKTLAMQSASESFTGDRAVLNSEFQSDIKEIDRQAQSIGLNNGGTFAKSLAVYLGAGSGSQSVANSVVTVDLSKAVVDSASLGMTSVQAVNSSVYDLSATSNTSVSKIIGAANSSPATIGFTFFGPGFSNTDGTKDNAGLAVSVATNTITDSNSLVSALNTAIGKAAGNSSAQAAAFKAANVVASIVTDAGGNQKLAFNSTNSGFEVQAGLSGSTAGVNGASNALLGFFSVTSGANSATGKTMTTSITTTAAITTGGMTVQATGTTTLTITGDGIAAGGVTVTLSGAVGTAVTAVSLVAEINAALANTSGVSAQVLDGKISFGDSNGSLLAINEIQGTGVTNPIFANGGATSGSFSSGRLVANDTYELGNSNSVVTALGFTGAVASGKQTLTVTANDTSGTSHPFAVVLDSGTTTNIDTTIGNINDQLQKSYDTTLQQITAVKVNTNGVEHINFVSTLTNFSVSIGSATAHANGATLGVVNGSGGQSTLTSSVANGSAGAADIGTISGAQAAVTAITAAVTALGSAQANVGKGQNALGFAISLAQSQITNLSAAEANIRDANVAQQAANLTKAQVLQQASIAAMAQANSATQAVLTLLRG